MGSTQVGISYEEGLPFLTSPLHLDSVLLECYRLVHRIHCVVKLRSCLQNHTKCLLNIHKHGRRQMTPQGKSDERNVSL